VLALVSRYCSFGQILLGYRWSRGLNRSEI
jgi:hypothetical protein